MKFLVLIFIISIPACKGPESKEYTELKSDVTIDALLDQWSIHLVSNKGVGFEYKLGDTTEFGEDFIIEIECVVINETDKEINYLNQSCNGLDYYLIVIPHCYKVMPYINCNASWAMINKLAPKDSLKFNTQILQFKDSKQIEKIGIDFRAIDKFIPFNILQNKPELVEKIYRSGTLVDNVIWGNKK